MTPEGKTKLKNLLINDEALKNFPYTDTTGHITIGVGRNLQDRGISTPEALMLLDDDILYFCSKLSHLLPWWNDLDDARQIVLVNVCFNCGVQGLLKFKDMLAACAKHDWDNAANELLDSDAAHRLIERYQRLAYILRTGHL